MLAGAGGRGGVIDGDLWWAGTHVTTVVGSGVIGKYFAANHYDYALLYNWNYITENGTNRIGIICPDGWRLPTKNEFIALFKASGFTGTSQTTSAGSVTNIDGTGKNGWWLGPGVATGGSDASKYPYTTDTHIFIPLAGINYSNNALSSIHIGSHGQLWSSTPHPTNSSLAYNLGLWSSTIFPQYSQGRTLGYSIRCVADAQ